MRTTGDLKTPVPIPPESVKAKAQGLEIRKRLMQDFQDPYLKRSDVRQQGKVRDLRNCKS